MPSSGKISDKPYGITNIKSYVPLLLDVDRMNYDAWRELFENHCKGFGVHRHLLPSVPSAEASISTADKATGVNDKAEWEEMDAIVKGWIYGTLAQPLLQSIIKKNTTAHDVWTNLEKLFRDNKDTRAMELDTELRNITLGDSSINDYFNRITKLADMLENIDAKVPDRNLVIYAINGLSSKYDSVATVIRHQKPFPTLSEARSMLSVEEQLMKLNDARGVSATHADHSSSPTALTAQTTNSRGQHQPYRGGSNNRGGGRSGGRFSRGGRNNRGGGRGGARGSFGSGNFAGQQLYAMTPWGWVPCSYGPISSGPQHSPNFGFQHANQQGLLPSPLSGPAAQQHQQSAQGPSRQ